MSSLRFPIAALLALGLSVGMFWGLHEMIGRSAEFVEQYAAPKIEFTRLRRDTVVEEKVRVKPEIAKPEPPSSAAPVVEAAQKTTVIAGTDIAALAPSVDFSAVGGGAGGIARKGGAVASLATGSGVDRGAVPQVRIQPDYPIAARRKGIEGWVEVQFTVGTDGSVRNPKVVAAEPAQIFDDAALRGVKGWKYNPRIQDGKPVEQVVRTRIRFQLES